MFDDLDVKLTRARLAHEASLADREFRSLPDTAPAPFRSFLERRAEILGDAAGLTAGTMLRRLVAGDCHAYSWFTVVRAPSRQLLAGPFATRAAANRAASGRAGAQVVEHFREFNIRDPKSLLAFQKLKLELLKEQT